MLAVYGLTSSFGTNHIYLLVYYPCRRGGPYEENKMAFIGACLWAVAALLTFLRSIQVIIGPLYTLKGH
jgi:hypothetical protein